MAKLTLYEAFSVLEDEEVVALGMRLQTEMPEFGCTPQVDDVRYALHHVRDGKCIILEVE